VSIMEAERERLLGLLIGQTAARVVRNRAIARGEDLTTHLLKALDVQELHEQLKREEPSQ
jgi:hypothetical protein